MNNGLRDALLKAGVVQTPPEEVETRGSGGEPMIPDPTTPPSVVDFNDFPEWAHRWAHAGIQLLGRAQLVRALEDAMDGTNRTAGAFEDRIEHALSRLPTARANELRPDLFSLYRGKGCPTFNMNARAVLDAVQTGAYDAWLEHEREEATAAEVLEIPQPERGENLETYRGRLDDWSADKSGALLKRVGFDAYALVQKERGRRETERQRVESEHLARAERELKAGLAGDFPSAFEFLKGWVEEMNDLCRQGLITTSFEKLAQAVVATSPWPWALSVAWDGLGWDMRGSTSFYPPTLPPTPSDGEQLGNGWLLKKVSRDEKTPLRAEVCRRWPLSPNQANLVEVESGEETTRYAVYPDGEVGRLYSDTVFPPAPGVYPTEPSPNGWWNRKKDGDGLWCDHAVYQALRRLERVTKGAVLITPEVASHYSRHPQKGYPRFYFEVSAGRRSSSFDLPVWRPQGEGWLAERLDDIHLVKWHHVAVPEAAYWMDVQLGKTAKGNPRLEPVHPGQKATPAILLFTSEGAMSQGKWGWSGETHSATKGSEKGGSKILWSTFVSSAGGGVHRTADLLWVAKNGSVGLDNGVAITFDGREIVKVAGGGLNPADDPTRE